MYSGDTLAEAVSIPVYYGIVEAIILSIYCICAWKMGWTKAPKDESFWVVITSTYEVEGDNSPDDSGVEMCEDATESGIMPANSTPEIT